MLLLVPSVEPVFVVDASYCCVSDTRRTDDNRTLRDTVYWQNSMCQRQHEQITVFSAHDFGGSEFFSHSLNTHMHPHPHTTNHAGTHTHTHTHTHTQERTFANLYVPENSSITVSAIIRSCRKTVPIAIRIGRDGVTHRQSAVWVLSGR